MKALSKLLDQERQRLIAKAVTENGKVDKESLEQLERLAKLIGEAGHLRRKLILGVAAVLAAALSFALFQGPKSTHVDLDLAVTEFTFIVDEPQPLLGQTGITTLSAGPFSLIELETGESFAAPATGGDCWLTMDPPAMPSPAATLTLTPFTPPEKTHVRLTRLPGSIRWALTAPKASADVQISIEHAAVASITCGPQKERRALAGPAILRAYPRPQFDLTLHAPRFTFPRVLAITQLALFEQHSQPGATPRILSGLLGGSVFFNDLSGSPLTIRPSETLKFQASRGELRAITAKPGEESMQLQASLHVEGMESGSASGLRTRMPSWLALAYANENLVRLGILIPAVGLIYKILSWFKFVQ